MGFAPPAMEIEQVGHDRRRGRPSPGALASQHPHAVATGVHDDRILFAPCLCQHLLRCKRHRPYLGVPAGPSSLELCNEP